jgi:DNA invertase Pin-like site-specific DNA recombinase
MPPKTAAIYARVSTNRQDVQIQLLELRRYCQARNWPTTEFIDNGFSGSWGDDKRPALKELLEAARHRKINVVVVWDFSRFARSLRQLVDALDSFHTWGISFISLREGIDTETANGRLMFGIFASLAEFERELTRERILLGLKKAKARGKTPGPRRTPVDLSQLQQEASKGLSLRKLAIAFSVSKDTVRSLLNSSPPLITNDPPPLLKNLQVSESL